MLISEESSTPSGFPMELLSCTNLRIINLDYQGIVSIPPEIEKLTSLTELRMSNNPNLLGVPAELGKIKTMKGNYQRFYNCLIQQP